MMKYILSILYIFSSITLCYGKHLSTVSIKGAVKLNTDSLTGDFLYSLKNDSDQPQTDWHLIVNSTVNILAVSQNNKAASIKTIERNGYRILLIKFPDTVEKYSRTHMFIKFAIESNTRDPRLTVSSNFVFLDSRRLWFPMPQNSSKQPTFEISISTPNTLYSAMGGKLISEAVILDTRIATWSNELQTISPSSSLIISETKRTSFDSFHVYSNDPKKVQFIRQHLYPYWEKIKTGQKFFLLSEIFIFPTDIQIPNQDKNYADGEFLGNLILLDNELVDAAFHTPFEPFFLSGYAKDRFVETFIHELLHAYFPGAVQIDQEENSLFLESLVQYLTWSIIASSDHLWDQRIRLRTQFLIQSHIVNKKLNSTLSTSIIDTTMLYLLLSSPKFDRFNLTDTIVEKYKDIGFTKSDIFETIAQAIPEKQKETVSIINSLYQYLNTNLSLNTDLEISRTNFSVSITNFLSARRKKIQTIPIKTTFINIKNEFPITWYGTLSRISDQNKTNSIALEIPKNSIWETNIMEENGPEKIKISSPLDILETDLNDNQSFDSTYIEIIRNLNNISQNNNIIINDHLLKEKVIKWNNEQSILLLNQAISQNYYIMISAFLVHQNNTKEPVLLFIKHEDNKYYLQSLKN
ncbi:MAG: hypothetical protein ACRCTQ_02560 [Brevinemataceae bacterium]